MAFDGAAWNETIPTNGDLANEIDDYMRDIKTAVSGRMAQEHTWPSSQSATNEGGLHKYITLAAQTSDPTLVVGTNTQAGAVYVSSASNNALVFKNSAGSVVTLVDGTAKSMFPAGVILPYGGTSAPVGFYFCTGGEFSRTTDSALFAAIGTAFGSGDGSTTFAVPDMQGSIPVGQSAGGMFATIGASTGSETHTLIIAEMPAHTHEAKTASTDAGGGFDGGNPAEDFGNASTLSTGGDGAHNNVQPSVVVKYVIAR